MEVLYLLLPISGLFTVVIVGALVWAVKSGQFDDLEGPAYKILMDDEDDAAEPQAREAEPTKARQEDHSKRAD